MRAAITNALVEQEALALQMREELSEAIKQAWPMISETIVLAPPGERERVVAEIIMAITADIISEHGEGLEDDSEAQAESIVDTLTSIKGNA